jgi:4-amino-4-deoxy-L-arabinose transferase-like glycosyltransferase
MRINLNKNYSEMALMVLLWGILVAVLGWIRPMIPSNEMHQASIAWEMHLHHQFLVPIQTGLPYAEKPPLLYWLTQLGWSLFGVSSAWIRLLPQLFMLGSLFLTRSLARCLNLTSSAANLAPLVLLGAFAWTLQIHITWFDMMLTFFCLLCWCSLYRAVQGNGIYWVLFGLAIGSGALAKGPVILLFVLPAAISLRWWAPSPQPWLKTYLFCIAAVLLGIAVGLAWAIPAALAGGHQYAVSLFLLQSVGRITGAHGVARPWYLYLYTLAIFLLPWALWVHAWRTALSRRPLLFLLISILAPLIILSLFRTKSLGYLLPCLPLIAIWLADVLMRDPTASSRRDRLPLAIFYTAVALFYWAAMYLSSPVMRQHYLWLPELSPIWGACLLLLAIFWYCWNEQRTRSLIVGITLTSVLFALVIQIGVNRVAARHNDWRPLALQIRQLQDRGITVAAIKYNPEELFEFFGRLPQPLVVNTANGPAWLAAHPDGWLLTANRQVSPTQYVLLPASPEKRF